jgi:hypothetical protein
MYEQAMETRGGVPSGDRGTVPMMGNISELDMQLERLRSELERLEERTSIVRTPLLEKVVSEVASDSRNGLNGRVRLLDDSISRLGRIIDEIDL